MHLTIIQLIIRDAFECKQNTDQMAQVFSVSAKGASVTYMTIISEKYPPPTRPRKFQMLIIETKMWVSS
jgi:hypothetical protein